MAKICGMSTIGLVRQCIEEECAWWVSSAGMCAIKDIAHTLKQPLEVEAIEREGTE